MKLNVWAWLLFPLVSLSVMANSPLANSPQDEEILEKANYTLSYNESHEVANWVAYELGHPQLRGCVKRANSFRADPSVSTGSAALEDYANSNFDRGHLVPAGDMKFTKEAMSETFFMSNMTPQPPKFNQGKWAVLENLMRSFALKYKQIWIVTGPILTDDLPTIGRKNRVSVPVEYFKVVLRKDGTSYRGIGFLMSVDVPYPEMQAYALSINEIEEYSGIDFFPFLNDTVEEKIEDEKDTSKWDFKSKFDYLPCSA